MKKLLLLSFVLVFLLALAGCSSAKTNENGIKTGETGTTSSAGDTKKITWKFGLITDENHPWTKIAQKYAELVNQKTNGQIEIKIFPNSQLGGEIDTLNSIKAGTADLTISGESMANWAPKAALMAVQ